ncbi:MAG TPA: RAMP superfamily CRISPR-associated protein, partial [Synergistaceae bacterium]|nr:RAMP superfamily CRISPR-associated protein [Synergistaceae bacterium]
MNAPAVPWTHKNVLRAVIEFTTPFLIGAGWGDGVADVTFAADANGLPALPGSSLAGVLRALYQDRFGEHATEALFGFQRRQEGAGSRLTVSWGCLHDEKNVPVEGIASPKRLNDPVLANAQAPTIRDHVRLTCRGAADAENSGKFDEHAVAAG